MTYRWTLRLGAPALFGLASLASAQDQSPAETSGVPIPTGQIEAAVGKVDGLVTALMARTGIPGMAVAVVEGGQVVFAKGYGVREAGKPEPVDTDTVFQLASVSKSIGATVVANQVSVGVVGWDTPVTELLPDFALSDPAVTGMLTIGDLYSHRSGLPDHAGDDLEDIGYNRRQVLERLRLLPLAPFRSSYAYTNFGVTAGAEAVAAAVGMDWETMSQQAIYGPLRMDRTSSRFADFLARVNRAVPHMRSGDSWAALEQRDPDAQSPAGGVSSSVADMGKWLRMLMAGGTGDGVLVARPEALLAALSPQAVSGHAAVPAARSSFYGYGFNVGVTPAGRVMLSHSGAFYLGAATVFLEIPSAGVGIVVLSNAQPIGAVETIAFDFADLVQFGEVTRDWFGALTPLFAAMGGPIGSLAGEAPPADPTPARMPAAYVGSYGNDYFGPLEIVEEAGGLVLRIGPAQKTFPLTHWSGDVFTFVPSGENAPEGSVAEVLFTVDGDAATTVQVDFWNENGLGTFTRGS